MTGRYADLPKWQVVQRLACQSGREQILCQTIKKNFGMIFALANAVPNGVKKRKSFVKISLHKKTSVQYCGLKNGRYNVDIREKERERKGKLKMKNEVYVASDCCFAPMTMETAQCGICPRCQEHCEVVIEVVPIPE